MELGILQEYLYIERITKNTTKVTQQLNFVIFGKLAGNNRNLIAFNRRKANAWRKKGTCVGCEKLDPSDCRWYDDGICSNELIKFEFLDGTIWKFMGGGE